VAVWSCARPLLRSRRDITHEASGFLSRVFSEDLPRHGRPRLSAQQEAQPEDGVFVASFERPERSRISPSDSRRSGGGLGMVDSAPGEWRQVENFGSAWLRKIKQRPRRLIAALLVSTAIVWITGHWYLVSWHARLPDLVSWKNRLRDRNVATPGNSSTRRSSVNGTAPAHLRARSVNHYVPKHSVVENRTAHGRTHATPKKASYGEMFGVKVWAKTPSLEEQRKGVVNITHFSYPAFSIAPPLFVQESHRKLFFKDASNPPLLRPPSKSLLHGEVRIVHDAFYDWTDQCGPKTLYRKHFPRPGKQATYHFDQLCPLRPPQAWAWQHFIDSALPKLMQAYELLQAHPRVQFLVRLNDRRFPAVRRLWHLLGFSDTQLVAFPPHPRNTTTYSARQLFLICHAPTHHPLLWQRMQSVLARQLSGAAAAQPRKALLLARTRANAFNLGRMMNNQQQVEELLRFRFRSNFVLFDAADETRTLEETLTLFQQAEAVIGAHGGAMYNALWASDAATVVEFMPTNMQTGALPPGLAGTIFWLNAALLGQAFWRVPVKADTKVSPRSLMLFALRFVTVVSKRTFSLRPTLLSVSVRFLSDQLRRPARPPRPHPRQPARPPRSRLASGPVPRRRDAYAMIIINQTTPRAKVAHPIAHCYGSSPAAGPCAARRAPARAACRAPQALRSVRR
jgi:hypothetical protein